MTLAAVMERLQSLGTEQNRKVYPRHGAGPKLFGVSFEHLRKLGKQLKGQHALAMQLWATGYEEARILATMAADPAQLTPAEAEAMLGQCTWYTLADELCHNLLARTPFAPELRLQWAASPVEFVGRAGWILVADALKAGDAAGLDPAALLEQIEREIHLSPNRKREAMNLALIALGIYRPDWTAQAIAAAERIGKVQVDHGPTNCKTPDAKPYILKALARKEG